MKYYSTNRNTPALSFREAVIKGLPEDNGLFMPEKIPTQSADFLGNIPQKTLQEIGVEVARPFVDNDLTSNELQSVV